MYSKAPVSYDILANSFNTPLKQHDQQILAARVPSYGFRSFDKSNPLSSRYQIQNYNASLNSQAQTMNYNTGSQEKRTSYNSHAQIMTHHSKPNSKPASFSSQGHLMNSTTVVNDNQTTPSSLVQMINFHGR